MVVDNMFVPADLDGYSADVQDRICLAVAESDTYYLDPDTNGLIYVGENADGGSFAIRLMGKEIGQSLIDTGTIRIVTGRGVPVPRKDLGPYESYLSRIMVSRPELIRLPIATGVYRLPAVIEDEGKMVQAWAGYHPSRRLIFIGDPLPNAGTERLYPHLNTLFSDIHFTSPRYRTNLIGYVVAALARPACRQFPFLVLDATSKRQGKTTVADTIWYLLSGTHPRPMTHTGEEAELEKRIASSCERAGPNLIYLDNVRPKRGQSGVIRSQFFAQAVNNPTPTLRPLYGRTMRPVDYPIILLTMNRASVENDLYDRVIRVVLSGEAGRYFDPSPWEYVQRYRTEILQEAIRALSFVDMSARFRPQTRFGYWEKIATLAAQEVTGEATSYSPDGVDTCDAVALEIYNLVQELHRETGSWPTLEDVARNAKVHARQYPELDSVYRQSRVYTDQAYGALVLALVTEVNKREIFMGGNRLHFVHHEAENLLEVRQ